MILDWTSEEKALSNIKKIIPAAWRMNCQQMRPYCQRLQKNQVKILPGRLGSEFLKILIKVSESHTGAAAKFWPALMQDTEHLQNFIQIHKNKDKAEWLTALSRLEAGHNKYFKTQLGRAFILVLQEKVKTERKEKIQQYPQQEIQNSNDLEKIALWLMEDPYGQWEKVKPKKDGLFPMWIRRTAIPFFAGMSACFMAVWLHGQVGRNLNQWNLQQMKVTASEQDDILISDNTQPEKVREPVPTMKKMNKKYESKDMQKEKNCPQKLPQYKEMSEQYPQLYGWLQIPDTQIDLPVMRPEGDREFYLHHDFMGAESVEGALFVDQDSSIYPQDDNTVIYGHNMKNGHIFGTLHMYHNVDFFQAHKEIRFDTIYETGIYEVIAVLKTRILNENEQGFRYYRFFRYNNEKEFQQCQDFINANRLFDTGSSLKYKDRILMLSTCDYSQENGRLIVVARRIK